MSTSEFDRQWEEQDFDFSSLSSREGEEWNISAFSGTCHQAERSKTQGNAEQSGLPEDFTEEDVAFAHEMEAIFSPDTEEMPPYYVQTLLETENPRFQPPEEGIEYKTKAHVFQRLRLRRRLFRASHFTPKKPTLSRTLLTLLATCILFMVFTMVVTGPLFASGLAVLLSGPHSGVVQVNGYPHYVKRVQHPFDADISAQQRQINLVSAQQQLQFTMYQPSNMPSNYVLNTISLYRDVASAWADGPVLEMDYNTTALSSHHESATISISEFKPNGQVFQVVQNGAAQTVQASRDGIHAVYVTGQWVRVNKFSHDWLYGKRVEIIYEHDGVVFWIAGDPHAGVDVSTLLSIASSLQPLDQRAIHSGARIDVTVSDDSSSWPFADDVVYGNGADGSSLEIVSADSSTSSTHTALPMPVQP